MTKLATPSIINASERLERIADLRELLKHERAHQREEIIADPLSVQCAIHSVSIAAMEAELKALERGVMKEYAG